VARNLPTLEIAKRTWCPGKIKEEHGDDRGRTETAQGVEKSGARQGTSRTGGCPPVFRYRYKYKMMDCSMNINSFDILPIAKNGAMLEAYWVKLLSPLH
jgi:hypothetical protein